jgi:hypothetical protein
MAIEQYRKSLHLRAARPQDLGFDAWLDFLAVAGERAPEVWRDLYETVWPCWRKLPEIALITCEQPLREWATRWWLVTPSGEPHPAALNCAHENMRLRVWREDNGQPQPPAEYVIPVTGYAHVRSGDEAEPPALPPPRQLQGVNFTAPWSVWRTGEPIQAARERLIREFTDSLDAHIELYLKHCKRAQYAIEAERRRWRQHLKWFTDYQLNGREVAQLLAGEPDADASTLRKALADAARILGLRIRPGRRGRPKK